MRLYRVRARLIEHKLGIPKRKPSVGLKLVFKLETDISDQTCFQARQIFHIVFNQQYLNIGIDLYPLDSHLANWCRR